MKKANQEILDLVRAQVREYVGKHHGTVEDFCWDKGLNKATMSNFLSGKKDFRISTLEQIAKAVGCKLSIQFKK